MSAMEDKCEPVSWPCPSRFSVLSLRHNNPRRLVNRVKTVSTSEETMLWVSRTTRLRITSIC